MTPTLNSGSTPMLSVLCLTYNHAAYIARALESFLAQQTDFEIEIVVADDCSTDETVAILERFRQRAGEHLHILTSPINLGITRNFRRALKACRGRYIAFCEGDDFWRGTTKLQTQVRFLESNPDVVITYHNATIVYSDGRDGGPQLLPKLRCGASREQLIATRSISTLTACFRHVLDEIPVELDQAPVLDLCLWSLLGHHGSGQYLPEIEPAGYQVHANGIFSSQTLMDKELMRAQSLMCLARVYGRRGQHAARHAVLLKANWCASVPLKVRAKILLLGLVFAQILASVFMWPNGRLFSASRGNLNPRQSRAKADQRNDRN
jgi:Glycosyl transferase family 2